MQELIKVTNNTNNNDLRNKIYTIRGVPVMLDFDLAEIYGYTTKAFNQQVMRNKEKFEDEDFMFRPTREEMEYLVRSQNVTSRANIFSGQDGGTRYLPHAFTESGIYMLMTVLKGDLATQQSKTLIRTFRAMKDYILENQNILDYRENLHIVSKVADHSEDIAQIKSEIKDMDLKVKEITAGMTDIVKKSDISPILLDFAKLTETHEFLIMNGEPARAKETFLDIYAEARHSICLIDNYIDIKTLRLFQNVKPNVEITIFSDNVKSLLRKSDYAAFRVERPDLNIKFIKNDGIVHDRYIILDNDIVFSCGASLKDAGNKITTIHKTEPGFVRDAIRMIADKLKNNPELKLK